MATNKERAEIAKELSTAKDWKEVGIENREIEEKRKKKEIDDMIKLMRSK